jgi:transcription-repair coupling factor (superfamily II helicase)
MRDRYGKIPRQGESLFTLAELRVLAEKLRVATVDYSGEKVAVRFSTDSPVLPQRLIEVVSGIRGAVLTPQGVLRLPVGPDEPARVERVRALLKALI